MISMTSEEHVVLVDASGHDLVDANGSVITMSKLSAHQQARLHRAISVFIFSSKNELLLQKRARGKYHSAGLWSNTCCSHPRPGERPPEAARRRLWEEMRIECDLQELLMFTYQADFHNGLSEYEYDHVFIGFCDESPDPDPAEVADWKWLSTKKLTDELTTKPEHFTIWLKCCFPAILQELNRLSSIGPDKFIPSYVSIQPEQTKIHIV